MLRLACLMVLSVSTSAVAETQVARPERVASADAGVTEIIVKLGAGDRLVAVDAASTEPSVQQLPRLGYHRQLAAEGVMSLDPDVVIGTEQMGPPEALDALRRGGVQLLVLPYPGDVKTLRDNVASIAAVIDGQSATDLLGSVDAQAASLQNRALTGLRAALLLRGEGGTLRMAGAGTGGGGFVEVLGAINVADYRGYRAITPEGVLELGPDVLLLADTEGRGVDNFLERYPVMRFSPALKADQLFTINTDTLVAGISLASLREAERVLEAARTASVRRLE